MSPRATSFVSLVAHAAPGAEGLAPFVREAHAAVSARSLNFELILVLDGPSPSATAELEPLLKELVGIRVLVLSRAFGRDAALDAGLDTALGDAIIALPARSDFIPLIDTFLDRLEKSSGIVLGVDPSRADTSFFGRLGEGLVYWIAKRLLRVALVPYTPQVMALSRQAALAVLRVQDRHRHLEVIAPYVGFGVDVVPLDAKFRAGGPRRGFFDAVGRALDVSIVSSLSPMRFLSLFGLGASLLSLGYIGYIFLVGILKDRVAEGWMTLSLQQAGMFFLLFFLLSIQAEYIGRVLGESRGRPMYFVQRELQSSVLVPNAERRNVAQKAE